MLQWTKNNFRLGVKTATIAVMFLVAVFAFLAYTPVFAQTAVQTDSVADPNSELNKGVQVIQKPLGLSATDPRIIVANIIKVALGLLGIIVLVLMLYAGFLWMTAGGNEEQIIKAKQILKNATIGLAIILMAYGIVAFIFRMLGVGGFTEGGTIEPALTQNFRGSGGLGKVVKDHYPMRNQKKVPRNTKIIISFFVPVKIDTFAMSSTNNNAGPGACGNIGASMNWETDCSKLRDGQDQLNVYKLIKQGDNIVREQIRGAALLSNVSTLGSRTGYYTIAIRPYDFLGSDTEEIGYVVRLGNALRKDDSTNNNPSIFENKAIGNDYYEWEFTCSTELDRDPPYVKSVYPGRNAKETKDTVMQIEFSEAMDPSGVQGMFSTTTYGDQTYYTLDGNNIFIRSDNSSMPVGEMNLTNGFTTLEFTPTIRCGTNACGDPKFCFPVCDRGGSCGNVARNDRGEWVRGDNFETLLRAGRVINSSAFEAIPFSGIMDAAGNALDGNRNGRIELATTTLPVFPNWEEPDNNWWNFILKDELDTISPFLNQVYPTYKAANVPSWAPWGLVFSKRMRIDPMYNIIVDEQPTPQERGDGIPLWKVPRVYFGDTTTTAEMLHGPFLDGAKQYYYPIATSVIQDTHFNCFYPGAGPGQGSGSPREVINYSKGGDYSQICSDGSRSNPNCCNVESSQTGVRNKDFCCNGIVESDTDGYITTTERCTNYFRKNYN